MASDATASEPPAAVDVAFRVSDRRYPLVRISVDAACTFELLSLLPREGDAQALLYAARGADPSRVCDLAAESPGVDHRLLADEPEGAVFEFEVTGPCPEEDLARLGAIPVAAEREDGTGRVAARIHPPPEPGEVVDRFGAEHPDATLVRKTEAKEPVTGRAEWGVARPVVGRLTDRQREVLSAAYEAGYYERPRETTGAELADRLGISDATLSQHVRAAERRLVGALFGEST